MCLRVVDILVFFFAVICILENVFNYCSDAIYAWWILDFYFFALLSLSFWS